MNSRPLLVRAALMAALLVFAFALGLCARLCETASTANAADAQPATLFLTAGPPLLRLLVVR